MMLNLRTLDKVVRNLYESINILEKYSSKSENAETVELLPRLKEAVVQNFEICYEQSRKFMVRFLKEQNIFLEIDSENEESLKPKEKKMFKKEILEKAKEFGLIENIKNWEIYNETRNNTSHTYDGEILDDIVEVAKKILSDTQILLYKMRESIKVNIQEKDLTNILKSIKTVVGFKVKIVYIFGSRITNNFNSNSDLDIALLSKSKLTLEDRNYLQIEFTKYDIPFDIDIIDYNFIEENFKNIIDAHYKPLYLI